MGSHIFYIYNDQSAFFSQSVFGKASVVNFGSIDFLLMWFIEFVRSTFRPVFGANLIIILVTFLNMILTYLLFKRLKINFLVSLLFAVAYSFSNYFIYRAVSFTPNLFLLFMLPLTLLMLLKDINEIWLGFISLLLFCFGSYLAYFTMLVIIFWYINLSFVTNFKFIDLLKKIGIILTPAVGGILIMFLPILVNNTHMFGHYKNPIPTDKNFNVVRFYRPIEDWYNLSFRPWYFFIPPKSSIFFGEFSKNIHEKIKNTGYYLADDYMEEEMAGIYMGWHFLIGLGVVGTLLLLKRYKNIEFKTFKTVYENKEMIIRSFFIIFCILLISGPPSFTIRGIEIYTPTYLLYYIVPVFRTLVRWAIVIYLFVLIINAFLVQDLYNLMKNKFQKILFILTFLTLNFVIFAIKIPVININKPPKEIAFVKEKYPESVPYAVYPKGDYYSIFWVISHEDLLINPVNFVNYETGFNSNEFSKKLITEEGIQDFLKQNPKYLIYYLNNISDDDLEKVTKINPNVKTKEDVHKFFKSHFGDGEVVGESVIFAIKD